MTRSDTIKQLWERGHYEHRRSFEHSEETKQKIAKGHAGLKCTPEHRKNVSEAMKEVWAREGMRALRSGENNSSWKGGLSFEPYCPKFNNFTKEIIRNRDGRRCALCGKSEILNGQRLSVHHIDGDKMQGCVGKHWYLCSLCKSCHNTKDTPMKEFLIVTNADAR